jgi:hypothetical protein
MNAPKEVVETIVFGKDGTTITHHYPDGKLIDSEFVPHQFGATQSMPPFTVMDSKGTFNPDFTVDWFPA